MRVLAVTNMMPLPSSPRAGTFIEQQIAECGDANSCQHTRHQADEQQFEQAESGLVMHNSPVDKLAQQSSAGHAPISRKSPDSHRVVPVWFTQGQVGV